MNMNLSVFALADSSVSIWRPTHNVQTLAEEVHILGSLWAPCLEQHVLVQLLAMQVLHKCTLHLSSKSGTHGLQPRVVSSCSGVKLERFLLS